MEFSSSTGSERMIISHLSKLKRHLNRVLSRIYRLEEKSLVAEGHELSGGGGGRGHPPSEIF